MLIFFIIYGSVYVCAIYITYGLDTEAYFYDWLGKINIKRFSS